jgi:O-antigen ligase
MPFKLEIDTTYDAVRNVALALALCAWVIQPRPRRQRVVWNIACGLIALYVAWAIVTMLWAPDLVEGRRKLIAYGMGLALLILITNQIRSLKALDDLMRTLAAVGWIMIAGGLYTMVFIGYQSGERLKVFGVNENLFGLLLILMMPAVIWSVLRASGPKHAIYMGLSVVYILCTIMMIALSGSRGSSLSLILVLLAFWFWRQVRPWALIGIALVAGMLTAAPFALDTLVTRFESQEGGDLGGRLVQWQASLLLLQDHPLTGVGVGNGPKELHWYAKSLEIGDSTRRDLPSHNPLLEAGVETGLIGMLIYVSVCVAALWQFFRYRNRSYMREGPLAAYFPLVLGTAVGYLATWVKGGGLEVHTSYFVLLALLSIPAQLFPSCSQDYVFSGRRRRYSSSSS